MSAKSSPSSAKSAAKAIAPALKVRVSRVPPEGLDLALPMTDLQVSAYKDTEADAQASKLAVSLRLHAVGEDSIVVSGRLTGTLVVPCDRCAEASTLVIDAPVNATFVPARELTADDDDDELELQQGDLDNYGYHGDEVDLEEMLREQLVVALPMTHLCKPACKGLCVTCGANWNEAPCACAAVKDTTKAPGKLQAALKNVKLS